MDVAAHYTALIGGNANGISYIWLLAVTPFQRRRGGCRYADIAVTTAGGTVHKV